MINGRCLCGAVRFVVTAPFEYSAYCHCSRCRMATGSAFASSAGVRKAHLRITQGEELITDFKRSRDATNHFCRYCGSLLYLTVRDGQFAHVQLGSLEDDPQIRPRCHCYVGSKASWHDITDVLPQFAELPERRPT